MPRFSSTEQLTPGICAADGFHASLGRSHNRIHRDEDGVEAPGELAGADIISADVAGSGIVF